MKNLRHLLVIGIGLMAVLISVRAEARTNDETLVEQIKMSADSFDIALEQRNFKLAKEHLEMIFPLIKKELKASKKQLHEFEKSGEKAKVKELKAALKQKTQIHAKLHAIVDNSSAALRVRSRDIQTLIADYVALLPADEQLVSAND